jgi:Leu/Phe-tRNA-protein transferase
MDKAVIFEFKVAKKFDKLSAECEDALKQIEDNNYAADSIREGYTDVMKYGIAFYKKRCKIMAGK